MRASVKLVGLVIVVGMAVLMTGCETTGSSGGSSTSGSRHASSQAGRKMILIKPDGTRTEIPYQEAPPSASFIRPPWEWYPERSSSGPLRIEVVIDEQRLYVYRGGVVIGESQISTGKEGHGTPAGSYKVLEKRIDHVSNAWGSFVDGAGNTVQTAVQASSKPPAGASFKGSKMPYFLRFSWDGVGVHEGFLPGYPASAGCIRTHGDFAKILFEAIPVGTSAAIVASRQVPRAARY